MINHSEVAQRLFREGYNCSQAVFCAFCDETGLDMDTAARLSSSFGGGIGRLREVCGAFSGAMLVFGMLRGYSDISDPQKKIILYQKIQECAHRIQENNGSIICRDLLKDVEVTYGYIPEDRTPEFYEKRPCLRLIGEAAGILDEMLSEKENAEPKEERR